MFRSCQTVKRGGKHFNSSNVHRPEGIKETSPAGCWFIYGEDGCRGEAQGGLMTPPQRTRVF
jgi:hypothetical protein